MTDYVEIKFSSIQAPQQELLIACLSESGYEGFEQNEQELKAFISIAHYDELVIKKLALEYQLQFAKTVIVAQNWNAVWESNFEPVLVDDFVAVRAHFHQPIATVKYEIIITPKMSFGTGHHATTFMMMQQMGKIDFSNKSVFDFGTGTGVLAILAEKLGANKVLANDIDEWSIENASENFQHNKCCNIALKQSATGAMGGGFDIILANINKNIILENMTALCKQLLSGGLILFSGLLIEDKMDILMEAAKHQLQLSETKERNGWLCLQMQLMI